MITEVRERKRLGKVSAGFDDGVEGNHQGKHQTLEAQKDK